jgi:hypothetical protein
MGAVVAWTQSSGVWEVEGRGSRPLNSWVLELQTRGFTLSTICSQHTGRDIPGHSGERAIGTYVFTLGMCKEHVPQGCFMPYPKC